MVQNCIEQHCVQEIVYPKCGWRKTIVGNFYVYGQGAIGGEGLGVHTISDYNLNVDFNLKGTKSVYDSAWRMENITSNSVSLLIFLYFHASLLTTLYEEAGYPINFLMGVIGVTGSRKTSLITTIAQLFNREKLQANAEFTSTSCGIEETISKFNDAMVIIDDFIPGNSPSEQAGINKKLQELIRFYGNRIPKKRMGYVIEDDKRPFYPIKGCCLLSGELISGINSSICRVFLLNVGREDVNNQILEYYQLNRWILPTYAYDFLEWVSQNYGHVVEYLCQSFSSFRKNVTFKYPRYSEMYAVMGTTLEIALTYATSKGYITEELKINMRNNISEQIFNNLLENERNMITHDTGTVLILAIYQEIINNPNEILLLTAESSLLKNVKYQDDERYYLQSCAAGKIFRKYIKENAVNCNLENDAQIATHLEAKNVLEIKVGSEGRRERARKLPIQRGNHKRYLWINKEKFKQALQEIEEVSI